VAAAVSWAAVNDGLAALT